MLSSNHNTNFQLPLPNYSSPLSARRVLNELFPIKPAQKQLIHHRYTSTRRSAGWYRWQSKCLFGAARATDNDDDNHLDQNQTYALRVKGLPKRQEDASSVGFVLLQEGDEDVPELLRAQVFLSMERSAFEAEYSAILIGLQCVMEYLAQAALQQENHDAMNQGDGDVVLLLQTDNNIIVQQLLGNVQVLKKSIQQLYWQVLAVQECNPLSAKTTSKVVVQVEQIPSTQNKVAKGLAQMALTTRESHIQQNNGNEDNDLDSIMPDLSGLLLDKIVDPMNNASIVSPLPAAKQARRRQEAAKVSHKSNRINDDQSASDDSSTAASAEPGGAGVGVETKRRRRSTEEQQTYLLQCDGGCRGNPGIAGAGMVIYKRGPKGDALQLEEVWCGRKYLSSPSFLQQEHLDVLTNNQAEYYAMILLLEKAVELGIRRVLVQSDSNLIVSQVTGRFAVRDAKLFPLYARVMELLQRNFDRYMVEHIPRAQNHRADQLANQAMDFKE